MLLVAVPAAASFAIRCSLEILLCDSGVHQIERLRQIDFLQQAMREPARIRRFRYEIMPEFAGKREIDHLRIGRFQVVVNPPGNG